MAKRVLTENNVAVAPKKKDRALAGQRRASANRSVKNRSSSPIETKNSIEQKPAKPFIDHYDLPSDYGTTYLTLVARDPFWIYVYWEVAASAIEAVKGKVGDGFDRTTIVLRMYDITCIDFNGTNAHQWFDLEVGSARNWYVNLWRDGVSYCAELGARMPDGAFFAFTRSNVVHTPRVSVSWRRDDIRMEVRDESVQPPFVVGEVGGDGREANIGRGGVGSVDTGSIEVDLDGDFSESISIADSTRLPEPAKPRHTRKVYLTEDDVRMYYSRLTPTLKELLTRRMTKREGQLLNINFSFLQKATLDELLKRGVSMAEAIKRLLLGSSNELVQSGSESSIPEKHRNFFFEINTELIVYGRTEPDANVSFGGRKVELRKDGTFTLRFALPDGKIPLDFIAESADKIEKREISTAVERTKTRCNP